MDVFSFLFFFPLTGTKKFIINFCMQILAAQFRAMYTECMKTSKYKNMQ